MKEAKHHSTDPQALGGETTQEGLPKVIYAEGVEDIADVVFDAQQIAGLMAREGISQADIAKTTFIMESEVRTGGPIKSADGQPTSAAAYCNPYEWTVGVSIPGIKKWAEIDFPYHLHPPDTRDQRMDEFATYLASDTLFHETDHLIKAIKASKSEKTAADQYLEDEAYFEPLVKQNLALRGIRKVLKMSPKAKHRLLAENLRKTEVAFRMSSHPDYDAYKNSPREVQADEFATRAMDQVTGYDTCPIQIAFKRSPSGPETVEV